METSTGKCVDECGLSVVDPSVTSEDDTLPVVPSFVLKGLLAIDDTMGFVGDELDEPWDISYASDRVFLQVTGLSDGIVSRVGHSSSCISFEVNGRVAEINDTRDDDCEGKALLPLLKSECQLQLRVLRAVLHLPFCYSHDEVEPCRFVISNCRGGAAMQV